MYTHKQTTSPIIRSYEGDPLLVLLIDKLKIKPIQISVLTFFVGFGVLSVWYWTMVILRVPDVAYRGLYAHYSSSYGDALIVPLIIGVIFFSYQNLNELFQETVPETKEQLRKFYSSKMWTVLTIFLAGIVTLIFHILAVFGNARNWTLPEYGKLNAPGYYHGVFMFVLLYIIFGYIIRLATTIWVIIKYREKLSDIEFIWVKNVELIVYFLLLIGLFGGLLAADRLKSNEDFLTIASILIREAAVIGFYIMGIPLYIIIIFLVRPVKQHLNFGLIILGFLIIFTIPVIPILSVYFLRLH